MDEDEEHFWVPREVLAEQPDKFDGGLTIIHGQRTAKSKDAGLFPGVRRTLGAEGSFEWGNGFAAVTLFGQR